MFRQNHTYHSTFQSAGRARRSDCDAAHLRGRQYLDRDGRRGQPPDDPDIDNRRPSPTRCWIAHITDIRGERNQMTRKTERSSRRHHRREQRAGQGDGAGAGRGGRAARAGLAQRGAAEGGGRGNHARRAARPPCFPADVTSEEQVRRVEREVLARYGTGPHPDQQRRHQRPQDRRRISRWRNGTACMDTNVTQRLPDVPRVRPADERHGYGRIINMTSIMSHVSLPGRAAYSTEQDGAARLDARAGAGTGAGRHHRQRHQPRPVRHRDEHAADAESGD